MQVNGGARPTQPKLAVPGHAKLVICDYAIERSFASLCVARFRRLARDYERLADTLAGLHFVAFAILMAHRFVTFMVQSS
jgi:threonine/homoserine/homoserine lactone efflux protein